MKKILNIFLAITIAFSAISVPAYAFVPQGAVKYSPDDTKLNQDFQGTLTDFTAGTTVEDESDGQAAQIVNGKLRVTNPLFNLGSSLDLGTGKTRYVLEFSVSTESDYSTTDTSTTNYSLYWYAPGRGAGNNGYAFTIPFDSISAGVVRTYQLIVNESATTSTAVLEKAFVKEGDGEYRQLGVGFDALKLPAVNCYVDFAPRYLDANEYKFYLGGKSFAGGSFDYNMPYVEPPVLQFDDIKIKTYKLVEGNTPNLSHGITYSEDFEGELGDFEATGINATQNTEPNGNSYYTLTSNKDVDNAFLEKSTNSLILPNTTITLDLKCETEGMPLLLTLGRPASLATIDDESSIKYGTAFTAVLNVNSTAETPTQAQFYVNGQPYGGTVSGTKTFQKEISGLKIGRNTIFAKVYCASGLIVESEPKFINVDYAEDEKFDITREYEVDYRYTAGNGKLNINDGYFKLAMSHTGDKLTYMTADGEESYEGIGDGDYKIIVTAGHAEIYWNGQFLTSILLLYDTSAAAISHSDISDVAVKSSGVKATLVRVENGNSFENDAFPKTQYYSLEFDKKDTSNEEIYINDGLYGTTISFRNDGIYAKYQLTGAAKEAEIKLSDTVKKGYYRLTVGYGIAQLFRNNLSVGNFRMVLGGSKPKIKRTVTNSAASTFMALKKTDDVYYHFDNFEGDTEFSHEEYWQAGPINYRTAYSEGGVEATRTPASNGNYYMKLDGTGVYVLNATDQYPNIKWCGRAEQASGKVFALLRQGLAQQHTKIGYDFDAQRWFFEIMRTDGTIVEAETLSAPNALKAGKWYDFEVIAEEFTVSLLVDGEIVFTTEIGGSVKVGADLEAVPYGRFGIGVLNSSYSFDDFSYKGQNRVTPGARTFIPLEFYGADIDSAGENVANDKNLDLSSVSHYFKRDGGVYAIANSASLLTTDNGKTWEKKEIPRGMNRSKNYTYMPDGKMVFVGPGTNQVQISETEGVGAGSPIDVHDGSYGYMGTGDRLRCTKDGRLFAVYSNGYEGFMKATVFYSDDGKQWTKSETEFSPYESGFTFEEAMVIDTPRKDEVWLYFRTQTGFITYFKSFDNGKTFDKTPHFSGLPQSATAYSIQRDPAKSNVYYAAFMYDTATSGKEERISRNHAALAVSYDGMENWHYVADLVATDSIPFLNFADLNMYCFGDGHLYWKTWCSQGYGRTHMGVQDLSKIKPLKRFPEYHFRYYFGYDPVVTTAESQCVISKTKGISWIYGNYYTSSTKNGKVDAATAEKIFGVTATGSGSTVKLALGDATIPVTADSEGYFDLATLCENFGKVLRESENSYCVMDNAGMIDAYQSIIDNLV